MARWNSCNVLQVGGEPRHLWQFDARGEFKINREHKAANGESLPSSLVSKSWSSLWQPRLNVAWLPAESVFLRVIHLPQSNPQETLSMVELQLEKLSPIPVTQAVWTFARVPQTSGDLQTLVVVFAERKAVEDYLGKLESQGFLADRLELPALDQLLATQAREDGAWIYPAVWSDPHTALVAWWHNGSLQNINFLHLPATGDRTASLKEQLRQMTWAGEFEGWLTSTPAWHLVANDDAAAEWEPLLRPAVDEPIRISPPLTQIELASRTARRAVHPDTETGLLPPEYGVRYHQQFIDRLWGRGLLAVGFLYCIGVVIYFLALGVQSFKTSRVENQVAALSNDYTNAVQLKARYQILSERQDLKYAALNCWKAVAETLPESLTLEGFNFNEGRRLTLNGNAPSGESSEVTDFYEAIRKVPDPSGTPLFDPNKGDPLSYNLAPGGSMAWRFGLELKRGEAP